MADCAASSISWTPKPSSASDGIVARDRKAERGEVARVQPVVAERAVEDERQRRVEQARAGRADVLLRRRSGRVGTGTGGGGSGGGRLRGRGDGRRGGGGGAGGRPVPGAWRPALRRRCGGGGVSGGRGLDRLLQPQVTEQGRKHGSLLGAALRDDERDAAGGIAAAAPTRPDSIRTRRCGRRRGLGRDQVDGRLARAPSCDGAEGNERGASASGATARPARSARRRASAAARRSRSDRGRRRSPRSRAMPPPAFRSGASHARSAAGGARRASPRRARGRRRARSRRRGTRRSPAKRRSTTASSRPPARRASASARELIAKWYAPPAAQSRRAARYSSPIAGLPWRKRPPPTR